MHEQDSFNRVQRKTEKGNLKTDRHNIFIHTRDQFSSDIVSHIDYPMLPADLGIPFLKTAVLIEDASTHIWRRSVQLSPILIIFSDRKTRYDQSIDRQIRSPSCKNTRVNKSENPSVEKKKGISAKLPPSPYGQ
jgi:hypothetical protein